MIYAHLHTLTDAEFLRIMDANDDPVFREAARRIEEHYDASRQMEADIDDANRRICAMEDEIEVLEFEIRSLEAKLKEAA